MTDRPRRVLVAGLDGATWDVIDPLLARGELPAIASLVRRGVRAPLRSTIPPVTAAAWPSLVSGKSPGRHGLFGFRTLPLAPGADEREFVSSRSIAGQTWFDAFSAAGARVLAYRVPLTYPVWPLNGVMVAGFPTPDLDAYTYPPEAREQVTPLVEADGVQSLEALHRATPAEALRFGDAYLRAVERDVGRFLDDDAFRLLMFVVSVNDYFQHRFWHLHQPGPADAAEAGRWGDVIAEFYRRQDACLGRLLQRLGRDDLALVVSDHGGGAKGKRVFNPNAWLARHGLLSAVGPGAGAGGAAAALLRLARRGAQRIGLGPALKRALGRHVSRTRSLADAVDWSATRAYYTPLFYPAAGLHLHVRGRQPGGTVEPGAEYEMLRDRLLRGLLDLRDPRGGRRVVLEAYRREEVYRGSHLDDAPDIVFVTDPLYLTWSRVDVVFADAPAPGPSDWTGDHRMEGVLIAAGAGVFRAGHQLVEASVLDVAPTVLHAAGLPVPAELDGRVLEEAFEPEFLRAAPPRHGEPLRPLADGASEYTDEEEAGIRAALRGLGYIE